MAKANLCNVNKMLFQQLEQLATVDVTDKDAMAAEIDRSRAMSKVAHTIIDNGKLMMEITRQAQEGEIAGAVARSTKALMEGE